MFRLFSFSEPFQITFPLHGQQALFGGVARFAGRHHIAFGAFAAARHRHDVIHGQLPRRGFATAVMADPLGAAPLPPLGLAQLAGLMTLAPLSFLVRQEIERVHGPQRGRHPRFAASHQRRGVDGGKIHPSHPERAAQRNS